MSRLSPSQIGTLEQRCPGRGRREGRFGSRLIRWILIFLDIFFRFVVASVVSSGSSGRRPGCRSGSRSRRPRTSRRRPGRESASILVRALSIRQATAAFAPGAKRSASFRRVSACPRTARTEPIWCSGSSLGRRHFSKTVCSVASGQKGRKCAQSGEDQNFSP